MHYLKGKLNILLIFIKIHQILLIVALRELLIILIFRLFDFFDIRGMVFRFLCYFKSEVLVLQSHFAINQCYCILLLLFAKCIYHIQC